MSKTTGSLNVYPIVDFVREIACQRGWKIDDKIDRAADPIEGTVWLEGEHQGSKICIVLKRHNRLPILLVQQFETFMGPGNPTLLSEGKFFGYNGKKHSRPGDESSNNLEAFWTVSCAKDLAATMRSYDYVARIYRCPTLFDLPPLT